MRQAIKRTVAGKLRIRAQKKEYENLLNNSGIYVIVNIINQHKYIGQSKHIKERWRSHLNSLEKNKHPNAYLQNAWNMYKKDSFVFEVLELCGFGELNEKEQYWIERLHPEYNIVKNIYEFFDVPKERELPDGYIKTGETFTRPKWHLWVYGGHRKSDCD